MSAATVPQLPAELVTHVLRELDQQQRLGSCSLVCRAWRAAAAALTTEVVVNEDSGLLADRIKAVQRIDSAGRWLHAHAAAANPVSVQLSSIVGLPSAPLLKLPTSQLGQLKVLSLNGCKVQVQQDDSSSSEQQQHGAGSADTSSSSSSSSQQSLSSLTSLTALKLSTVQVAVDALDSLSTLTQLQQLHLESVYDLELERRFPHWERPKGSPKEVERCVLRCLAAATQLTQLHICCDMLTADAVGPFAALQQLQNLDLGFRAVGAEVLLGLPQSLTKLSFKWSGRQALSSSTCPALPGLTALQQLSVYANDDCGGLLPDFCSSLQQLREVSLKGAFNKLAKPALLRAFSSLSVLERLTVSSTETAWGGSQLLPVGDADLAMYASLLPPSQHLTFLEVSWNYEVSKPLLQPGCGQHLFAAGRQLPQLKQLVLGVPSDAREQMYTVSGYGEFVGGMAGHECFGKDDDGGIGEGDSAAESSSDSDSDEGRSEQGDAYNDLDRLVSCCPGLEILSIPGLVRPGVSLALLLQLTALRNLCIGGEAVDDAAVSSVLVQLTQLQRLELYCAGMSDEGLLALTALRRLQQLRVGRCVIGLYVESEEEGYGCLELQEEGSGLPVWAQLLQRCVRSREVGKQAIKQLLTMQTEVQQQQAHALELQQQLAAMQARLETAEAHADGLQQQLAAAQSQLAASEVQTGGLQQQLKAAESSAIGLQQKLAASEARADGLQQHLAAAHAELAAARAQLEG